MGIIKFCFSSTRTSRFIPGICACAITISVIHINRHSSIRLAASGPFVNVIQHLFLLFCIIIIVVFSSNLIIRFVFCYVLNISQFLLCCTDLLNVLWFHSIAVFDRFSAIIVEISQVRLLLVNIIYLLIAGLRRSHLVATICI